MLLLFDGKGDAFVKELIRDGAADVDGTIHIGDQVTYFDVRIRARARDTSVTQLSRGRIAETQVTCRPGSATCASLTWRERDRW